MKIIRDPQILNGFIYERPLDSIPAVTHCGEAVCRKGHALKPHSHRGFEFLFLVRGTAHWTLGKRTIVQMAGDLLIVRPEEVHATGPGIDTENHHLWIGLRLGALGDRARRLERRLLKTPVDVLHHCRDAEAILRGFVGQIMAFRPRREEVGRAYLDTFVALVEQSVALEAGQPAEIRMAVPYSYRVQKAVAYMERHSMSRVSLAELAGVAAFRAVPHFCSQFRREVGASPAAYHLQTRLTSARDALRQTEIPITTIALQYGFSSSQHFSTAFRKFMNCSPRQWRQNRN